MEQLDLLNLPNINVLSYKENDEKILVFVESKHPPKCCQKCGTITDKGLKKYGTDNQLLFDIPMRGKKVILNYDRQRYQCHHCRSTFWEDLYFIKHESHFATIRLIQYIEQQSLKRTFTSIADEVGVDEGYVRKVFKKYVAELEKAYKFQVPEWLGIDEIHMIGKPRCVLANVKEKTIIDILKDRNLPTLRDYFIKIRGKRDIQYVTMDMWQGYKTISKEMLPQAKIVIDKFHVVKMANYYLDLVRKRVRTTLSDSERKRLMRSRFVLLKRRSEINGKELDTLNKWLKTFPALDTAYTLKELFYDIYEAKTREEAIQLFHEWQQLITDDVKTEFMPLANMVNNWFDEIFNYFDCPRNVTNAYTESLNNLIRSTHRQGRGYSFDAIRAKMLFSEGVQKKPKRRVNKVAMRNGNMCRTKEQHRSSRQPRAVRLDYDKQLERFKRNRYFGSDISTLCNLLEDGVN